MERLKKTEVREDQDETASSEMTGCCTHEFIAAVNSQDLHRIKPDNILACSRKMLSSSHSFEELSTIDDFWETDSQLS